MCATKTRSFSNVEVASRWSIDSPSHSLWQHRVLYYWYWVEYLVCLQSIQKSHSPLTLRVLVLACHKEMCNYLVFLGESVCIPDACLLNNLAPRVSYYISPFTPVQPNTTHSSPTIHVDYEPWQYSHRHSTPHSSSSAHNPHGDTW